jgi:hypothetical protein
MAFVGGLDSGGAVHAVCIIDKDSGAVAERFEARYDAEGLRVLVRRLARLGEAAALPVAIERPSGLIVDVLVEAGHPVVPIHPNVVKAARPLPQPRTTAAMPICSPTSCAPTAIASDRSSPPPMRSAACVRSLVAATTWWRPASRWSTSSAASWTPPETLWLCALRRDSIASW